MKYKRGVLIILITLIILLIVILFLVRHFSLKDLDDVSPGRYCLKSLIDKSDILFVIPLLNNVSIADNESWCEYILSLNKTIGMHGVYHAPDVPGEFVADRDRAYIQKGMEEFKRCFGFYPSLFEAPQLRLSDKNSVLLREMNLKVFSVSHAITHKTYHCTDQGQKSSLVWMNRIVEWF